MEAEQPRNFGEAETLAKVLRTTRDESRSSSKDSYYDPAIRYYFKKRGVAASDVDDLTQEAKIFLYTEARTSYDPRKARFRAFFCRVLQNLLLHHFRRQGRAQRRIDELKDQTAGPQEELYAEELPDVLRFRMKQVFDDYCDDLDDPVLENKALCLWLRLDGMKQKEVADRSGVSRPTLKKWLEEASARFWVWVEERVHPRDWEELVPAELRPGIETAWLNNSTKRRALLDRLDDLFLTRGRDTEDAS